MKNDEDDNAKSANKGVNMTPDAFAAVSETDTSFSTINAQSKSLTRYIYNTSSDADNEDSVFSSVPMITEGFKVESSSHTNATGQVSTASTPRENADIPANYFESFRPSTSYEGAVPPHLCVNPACVCMMGYMNQTSVPAAPQPKVCGDPVNIRATRTSCRKGRLSEMLSWIKNRSFERTQRKQPCELYKINIVTQEDNHNPPRRLVFDLVDGIPKPEVTTVATNTKFRTPIDKTHVPFESQPRSASYQTTVTQQVKEMKNMRNEKITKQRHKNGRPGGQKATCFDSNGDTRVDFYYFDHGNAQYFHTTDTPPVIICEVLAEKTERYTTKFWAQIFTTIHVFFSFCVSFVLQLFKFLLYSVVRPLTVGLMQLASDYFFKPCLTTLFNGIIQPLLIFFYNIATSLRDLCDPVAEGIGYFLREFAILLRAIRLCSYKRTNCETPCDCGRKCICDH